MSYNNSKQHFQCRFASLFSSDKSFPVPNIPDYCSSCKEAGFIQQVPSSGFLIIVNEKGKCILVSNLL